MSWRGKKNKMHKQYTGIRVSEGGREGEKEKERGHWAFSKDSEGERENRHPISDRIKQGTFITLQKLASA